EIRNTAIGAGGMTFASLSSSGAQSGIVLENTGSGSFAAGGGSIADASLRGVDIEGGSGYFTYACTVGTTATGRSVEVTSHTAGTVLFSGAIDDDGLGLLLASNAGATVRFTGALDTRPASGNNGFTAAGGGTVEVDATGPSANNIVTSDARALHVEDTTIGSAGLEFASISSSGGDYGIYLKNTGTSGGLLVTGQPSVHGSGGTIQGATIDGVYLENAGSVALYQMLISGSDDNNVHAVNVTGLTLDSVSLLNSGNTGFLGASVQDLTFRNGEVHGSGDAAGEQGIDIQNLLGASSITGTTFQDNSVNQLRVVNSTATVSDVLTLSGNTFSSPTPGIYGDQVQVESNTAGNLRLVINTTAGNNAMTGGVIGLHAIATNQGVLEVQISQATIGDTASVGVNLDSTNKGVLRFNVSGVTVTNTGSHGINATSSGDAVLNGTIQNNSVNGTG